MKILTTSLLAALALPAAADILTLKDGTKLDATILEKTLEEYQLEVNVTKSIKELRTIKRSEVVNVEPTNQADSAFEDKIAGLTPAPPFLDLSGYDSRIKTIKSFLRSHQRTSAGIKATKMLRELEDERKVIAEGGIKTSLETDGMISAAEREKDALGIESQIAGQKFKKLVESRAYLRALRQYDVIEQNFFATTAHREALSLMLRLTNTYATLLSRELDSIDLREKRRMTAIEQLSASAKARAAQAEELRLSKLKVIWEKEEEEEQRWLTIDTQDGSSLEDAISALEEENTRLSELELQVKALDDPAELFREGWITAGDKKQEELEAILDSMDAVGASEDYINKLIDRFDPTINHPLPEEELEGEEDAAAEDETETSE